MYCHKYLKYEKKYSDLRNNIAQRGGSNKKTNNTKKQEKKNSIKKQEKKTKTKITKKGGNITESEVHDAIMCRHDLGDRIKLPYRSIAECYLLYENKLVAQDMKKFIAFPGGGIDPGETPEQAGIREVMEETGFVVKGGLTEMMVINWDWFPEWASNEKRKDRYSKFRGENVHYLFGVVEKKKNATSEEGDAWEGDLTMDLDKTIDRHIEISKIDNANTMHYRAGQLAMLRMLKEFRDRKCL